MTLKNSCLRVISKTFITLTLLHLEQEKLSIEYILSWHPYDIGAAVVVMVW